MLTINAYRWRLCHFATYAAKTNMLTFYHAITLAPNFKSIKWYSIPTGFAVFAVSAKHAAKQLGKTSSSATDNDDDAGSL